MDSLLNLSVLLASCIVGAWWLRRRLHAINPNRIPLPPGPKGYPIIGNLLDLPTEKSWLAYNDMFKTYGDMFYLNVFGQGFLILGTQERIKDLLENRSKNYSDRIHSPMILDLMDWGYNLALLPYGSWWRRHRRAFHNFFHQNVSNAYVPIQLNTTHNFIRNLLESPKDFDSWIALASASMIMEVAYGIKIGPNDPYVKTAEEALEGVADAGVAGRYWVEMFPIMKHIPSWFPGAGWKRKAYRWRDVNHEVCCRPFNIIKSQMKEGTAAPSICRTMVERLPDITSPDYATEEEIAVHTCAVAFIGGSDTTISSLRTFFMAMTLYPEVQRKGQSELDAVLKGRLPEFNDRSSLPYINAIIKETLRWQPVVPLALPHMTTNADEYDGYYIPKGTIVFGNAWTLLHDPEVYKNPEEYTPDRFLKDGKLNEGIRDPSTAAFGFGRRICPGRHFVDNALFLMIAHTMTVFDIKPALDGKGNEIKFKPDVTGGLISQPVPFPCRILPRSKAAAELIHNSEFAE